MTMERKFWKITRWVRAGRFWLFLALAGFAWLGVGGAARAQSSACMNETILGSGSAPECPDAMIARAQAIRAAEYHIAQSNGNYEFLDVIHSYGSYRSRYLARYKQPGGSGSAGAAERAYLTATRCPEGSDWDEPTQQCVEPCSSRSSLLNVSVKGSFNACSDGCQFEQDSELSVCLGSGPDMYCGGAKWRPTGQQCQVGDATPQTHNPDQETCRSTGGGWSECVKPNGDHCVTGAKGTRMCWQPGETGQRNDTANIEWADRVPAGDTPTPPSNIENPTQETTTADKGGVSGDAVGGSFVIGGGSGTGNSGGQNNTGSGGTGSGDGEGDNEHGAPGSGLGSVYESDGKTVADIFGVFRARAENAPVIDAATGFLEVSAGSGCPVFTLPATEFWDSMTFDYHCSGPLADNLALGAYLLMAIAAFIAFRVAFH